MKSLLIAEIKKLDKGEIGYATFIAEVRKIANESLSKEQIIAEYFADEKQKEILRKRELAKIYRAKFMSDPKNVTKRAEADRKRYLLQKQSKK